MENQRACDYPEDISVIVALPLHEFTQFITSAKEIMFLPDFVRLSVCLYVCVCTR